MFDLVCYFAKLLIRLKVRAEMVPDERFDAYPERQFVTEFLNINSLANHHIWSTIKTLPATLPEPSSMDRGSGIGGGE